MKSFLKNILSREKVINNIILNILGLQVIRIFISRIFEIINRNKISKDCEVGVSKLKSEGILVLEDFLTNEEYDKINNFYNHIFNDSHSFDIKNSKSGNLFIESCYISKSKVKNYDFTFDIIYNDKIMKILNTIDKRTSKVDFRTLKFQNIRYYDEENNDNYDDQSDLHEDTFHQTFKGFYFLNDVSIDNNPFVFVKGSHKASLIKIFNSYIHSIKFSLKKINNASRRISDNEVKLRGLKKTICTLPANSLVIANTNGYHARFNSQKTLGRQLIGFNIRFSKIF